MSRHAALVLLGLVPTLSATSTTEEITTTTREPPAPGDPIFCSEQTTSAACLSVPDGQCTEVQGKCLRVCSPEPVNANASCTNYCTEEDQTCVTKERVGPVGWDACQEACKTDPTCERVTQNFDPDDELYGVCFECDPTQASTPQRDSLHALVVCKPCKGMSDVECEKAAGCALDGSENCIPQCTFTFDTPGPVSISECGGACAREGYEVESYLEAKFENQDQESCYTMCRDLGDECAAFSHISTASPGGTCVIARSPFYLVPNAKATTYVKSCRTPDDFCQNYISTTECVADTRCTWDATKTCKRACQQGTVSPDGKCETFCIGENYQCSTPASVPTTAADAAACQQTCANTVGCNAFVFNYADNSCVACDRANIVEGGRSTIAGYPHCAAATTTTLAPMVPTTTESTNTDSPDSNDLHPAQTAALGTAVAYRSNGGVIPGGLSDANVEPVTVASRAPLAGMALAALAALGVVAAVVMASRRSVSDGAATSQHTAVLAEQTEE